MIPAKLLKALLVGRYSAVLRALYLARLCQTMPHTYRRYRKLPSANRKSFASVIWDLFKYTRYIPNDPRFIIRPKRVFDEYCKERIFLKGNDLSDYILQREWGYLHRWYLKLYPEWANLLSLKKRTADFFSRQGIHTPRQWGYLSKNGHTLVWHSMPDGRQETLMEVLAHESSLFFKPEGGAKGAGCFVLSQKDGQLCLNGQACTEEQIAAKVPENRELLAETYVQQHPALSSLYPHSLNTLRLITVADKSGHVQFIRGFLRLGVGTSRVDNWYAGGLVIRVDEDGVLHGKGIYLDYTKPDEERHPDTGIEFEGYSLPMFDQAVAMVEKAHQCCKELPLIGWDVATTERGPLLVEANTLSGVVQGVTGGFRKYMNRELLPRVLETRAQCVRQGMEWDMSQHI